MSGGDGAAAAPGAELLAVLRSPRLLRLVQDGLCRIGAPPALVLAPEEALVRIVAPGRPPLAVLLEEQPGRRGWGALRAVSEDPFGEVTVLMLGGIDGLEDAPGILAALRRLTGRPEGGEAAEVAALRLGLSRGEVAMRYQPIVRIADCAPVGVEGLVRWLRPDGRQGATPLGPDSFLPMAERGGLSVPVARAVGRMAAEEMNALRPGLELPVSINLPLEVLLRADTVPWLARLLRGARMRPEALSIELTETTPVRDRAVLRRAVERLRGAGHAVWIDDMTLDRRDALMDLPFSGVKLDRHLVGAMPASRRARAEVERLVAMARRRGMLVTAEGVTDGALWRALQARGVDHAQGFAVGRPLPATGLPAWASAWRASGPPRGRAE
ncbi:EAL domain-containing protein [Roseomonas nepalensis]|uniref:EAL domain-containing protein n=1 Tax=Muricoccus nepalensis TaxID=1854500 RepID=A0A502FDD1_9PROT|nr:EAL domain-containing protein [Roseomonas nepalensis]TPG47289.1 EAL domain-containing protein [Roseomonas nepalensis]